MRRRVSAIGVFLLVMIVMLGGLTSCQREAQSRELQPDEGEEGSQESGQQGEIVTLPTSGETVVSAVTSLPAAGTQPALGAEPGATAAVEPAVPEPSEPAVSATPGPVAPQPTSPPQAPSGNTVTHTVQRGETLSSIALRYGTTWQAIAQANNLSNPNAIYVGQKLKVPTSASSGSSGGTSGGSSGCRIRHTVKQGEWVWQIARNYGVSPYDILSANGLTVQSANTIYAGKVLCIP
jgi:LysM repeat protein